MDCLHLTTATCAVIISPKKISKKNFVVELTGQKIEILLKRGAVPSLFSFGPPPKQPRVTSVARAKKRADEALTK